MKLDEEAVLQLDDTYFVQEMLTPAAFKFQVIGLVKALCPWKAPVLYLHGAVEKDPLRSFSILPAFNSCIMVGSFLSCHELSRT